MRMHCHQGNLITIIFYPPLSSATVCLQLSKKTCLHSSVNSRQRYLEPHFQCEFKNSGLFWVDVAGERKKTSNPLTPYPSVLDF